MKTFTFVVSVKNSFRCITNFFMAFEGFYNIPFLREHRANSHFKALMSPSQVGMLSGTGSPCFINLSMGG